MLEYRKGWAGAFIILRAVGTAWPYGIIPGLVSATISLALSMDRQVESWVTDDGEFLLNQYPFQLFAYLVGFFVVFRTNWAYRRYWLALDAVQRMGSRWLCGACLATAADAPGAPEGAPSLPYLQQSIGDGSEAADGGRPHGVFYAEVVHLFSLLHALALLHLRQGPNLDDLQDSAWEGGEWMGRASTNGALGRAGSSSTNGSAEKRHQPVVSHLFSVDASKVQLQVLGNTSVEELKALFADASGREFASDARVTMVTGWIMRRLIGRQKHEPAGDMSKTSPPILSRLFALISDGGLAFSQAKWIAEVPFPFPYHNLKEAFLWIYAITVPFVVNAKVRHDVVRIFVSFIAVWSYFSMAKVGDDLEDPFESHDPNDLPLHAIHNGFNVQLLSYGFVPNGRPLTGSQRLEEVGIRSSQYTVPGKDPGD